METGWQYVLKRLGLFIVLLVLCVVIFGLGLMTGYALIGDGEQATAILSPDKWQELIGKFTGK